MTDPRAGIDTRPVTVDVPTYARSRDLPRPWPDDYKLKVEVHERTVICTTNAIESINARLRRAVNARGHFPAEQAALKCLYLAIMSLDPTGKGRKRWTSRWKAALNAFDITFDGRLSAGRK
jgi:putative transposase